MKKRSAITISAISVSLLAIGISAGLGAKTTKETVFHCGCTADGLELVWRKLNVGKGKGHRRHLGGMDENCFFNSDSSATYVRGDDDCEEAGGPNIALVPNCGGIDGDSFSTDLGEHFHTGDNCED